MNAINRILVVDQSEAIQKDYLKILCPRKSLDLSSTEAFLFDEQDDLDIDLEVLEAAVYHPDPQDRYTVDFAENGADALSLVAKAETEQQPYAFVFADAALPDMQGPQLAGAIWRDFPETEIVLVTTHTDYSWEDLFREVGESSRLLIIKKPFNRLTISQLAVTLTAKKTAETELKNHRDHLQQEVDKRTVDLVRTNRQLARESSQHRHKKELLENVNRLYVTLFDRNEVSIWYEDFTHIKQELDRLRAEGVMDLEAHLRAEPNLVKHLAESATILDVSEDTMRMFRAKHTPDLLKRLGKLFSEENMEIFIGELLAIWNGESTFRVETEQIRQGGGKLHLVLSMSIPTFVQDFARVPFSLRDVTQQKQAEEILKFQAYYDDLTKLANKKLFGERLELALEEVKRKDFHNRSADLDNHERSGWLAVLFIDLDGFKAVNDTLGHHAGDLLLQQVADRLRECVKRRSDTVARLGGDEFAVILTHLAESHHAEIVGRRILDSLNRPFPLILPTRDGEETAMANISGSIGVAIFPDDASEAGELVEKADTAMYKAKRSGKNALCFFTQEMEAEAYRRRTLEKSIVDALKEGQFELIYQPVVTLDGEHICGAEAFLRWNHPELGVIGPDAFLTLAEENGLIVDIDRWVIAEVGRHLPKITKGEGFTCSINLSNRICRDARFVDMVDEALAEGGANPSDIIIDIRETLFLKGGRQVKESLTRLKDLGLRLCLDDFGAGVSSLTEFADVPFDFLRLDREIIEKPGPLTSAAICVAHNLGITAIAEGVESEAQAAYLREQGCDWAQGYWFGKPTALDIFSAG